MIGNKKKTKSKGNASAQQTVIVNVPGTLERIKELENKLEQLSNAPASQTIIYSDTPVKVGTYKGKDVLSVIGKTIEVDDGYMTLDNFPDNVDKILFMKIIEMPNFKDEEENTILPYGMVLFYNSENKIFRFYFHAGLRDLTEGAFILYHYTLK